MYEYLLLIVRTRYATINHHPEKKGKTLLTFARADLAGVFDGPFVTRAPGRGQESFTGGGRAERGWVGVQNLTISRAGSGGA